MSGKMHKNKTYILLNFCGKTTIFKKVMKRYTSKSGVGEVWDLREIGTECLLEYCATY